MIPERFEEGESTTIGWVALADLLILAVVVIWGYGQFLDSSRDVLSEEVGELQEQLHGERQQKAELDQFLAETREQVLDLQGRMSSLMDEIEMADQRESQLKEEVKQSELANANLLAKLEDSKNQNTALTAAVKQLQSKNGALVDQVMSLVDQVNEVKGLLKQRDMEYQELLRKLKFTETVKADLKIKLDDLTKIEQGFRQELLGVRSRTESLKRVVFIVDRSESMKRTVGGPTDANRADRWNYVKSVMETWINLLPCEEAVLVTFNQHVTRFPKSGTISVKQQGADELIKILDQLSPTGLTNTNAALQMALAVEGVDAIFLFTDGQPTDERKTPAAVLQQQVLQTIQQHVEETELQRETPIPINVIGLGDYFGEPQSTSGTEGETQTAIPFGEFLVAISEASGGTFLGR